jgi:hypothetical protein
MSVKLGHQENFAPSGLGRSMFYIDTVHSARQSVKLAALVPGLMPLTALSTAARIAEPRPALGAEQDTYIQVVMLQRGEE